MNRIGTAILASLLAAGLAQGTPAQSTFTHGGPCDASAAVGLDADHFVVANDEDNVLRIHRHGRREALQALDLGPFLGTRRGDESDIEGAAAVGDRVYWITSHGRNSSGKPRPSRQRFFATDVRPGTPPSLVPVGKPYADLVRDLTQSAALAPYRLAEAATRAPEAPGGLNIEGLAAAPDGTLLVGLRNPLAGQRALLIPLLNPGAMVSGERASLGMPIELDLGGRGIRSIDRIGNGYVIAAGPPGDSGSFAIFRWSGKHGERPVPIEGVDLADLRPEALFALPRADTLQLLSDDGGIRVDGGECKDLPAERQAFRAIAVKR